MLHVLQPVLQALRQVLEDLRAHSSSQLSVGDGATPCQMCGCWARTGRVRTSVKIKMPISISAATLRFMCSEKSPAMAALANACRRL